MEKYTKEQLNYINFLEKKDTKLIACAGSGKTKCIIERISNLILKKIYQYDQLLVLTFSRFTRDDFINKFDKKNVKIKLKERVFTIDSFANNVLGQENFIDVSILSYSLYLYIEQNSKKELLKNDWLNKIKAIFVDEAQDLNKVQYDILILLKKKLNIKINLIGDPNQNIFQFRGSTDKYLNSFGGKQFKLTTNFRSHNPVVNFSSYLRPYYEHQVKSYHSQANYTPIISQTINETDLEYNLMELIKYLRKHNDLSEIAILAPTRGYMKNFKNSYGLCLISNILHQNKIPFKQFYQEINSQYSISRKYKPTLGKINLLTYMGSKGLEWKHVIVLDADCCLINKKEFSKEKHNNDQYLLYVACSRAIENVYVFYHCRNNRNLINPWFSLIPSDYYKVNNLLDDFDFPNPVFNKEEDENMSDSQQKIKNHQIYENYLATINYSEINKVVILNNKEINITGSPFLIEYLKLVIQALSSPKNKPKFKDIENIANSIEIIEEPPYYFRIWYFENKNNLSWRWFYEQEKNRAIDYKIIKFVRDNFNQNIDFKKHILSNGKHYEWFVFQKRKWIKEKYNKYLNNNEPKKIIKNCFFINLIRHVLKTNHYYHMEKKGSNFWYNYKILDENSDLILKFVENLNIKPKYFNYQINSNKIVDIIDENDEFYQIELDNSVPIKNIINLCNFKKDYGDIDVYKLNFIQPLFWSITNVKINKDKAKKITQSLN
jgi:hypothetical protein